MKKIILIALTLLATTASAQTNHVRFRTTKGDFTVVLYDDTPIHRDNFLRLVRDGYYDGIIFHRVIDKFMVQTGDSSSRHAEEGMLYGDRDVPYTLPAEILFPKYYHHSGALAAAREGDEANPERRSSGAQFYVVTGTQRMSEDIAGIRRWMRKNNFNEPKWTADMLSDYATRGGAPHLDSNYTVFGKVTEGMETIDKIQRAKTDEKDRPLKDIRIIKAEIIE